MLTSGRLAGIGVLWALSALIPGCAPRMVEEVQGIVELDPGFRVFPTPRDFDGPGTVFRVNAAGTKLHVATLSLSLPNPAEEQLATYSKKESWSVSGLATFAGAASKLQEAKVGINMNSSLETKIQYGKGSRRRIPNEATLKAAIDRAGISFQKDSSYYVVYETIAVPEVNILIEWSSNPSADAKANVKSLVNAGVSVKADNEKSITLAKKFSKDLNVFYTVDQILPPGSGLNTSGKVEVIKLEPREMPKWQSEELPNVK